MISKTARILLYSVFILIGIGMVMTYSASAVYADYVYRNPMHFLIRQVFFVISGTVVLFMVASIPVYFWKNHARAIILFSIVLLLLVFIPKLGFTAGGARRWIRLGFINFQPAEFAKVAVCIYLSDYLGRKVKTIKKGRIFIFLPPLVLIGTICLLILMQPDLGSCAFILMMTAVLLFLAGLRMRYVVAACAVFLPILYFLVIRVPYRLSRVTAYLNPWEDREGSGYQMIQSFLAFGLGGWKGVGLGQSTQKLFYLPSSYNDFILAIIGEELGLLGVLGVILLFCVLFICGVRIALRTTDFFSRMLVLSLTCSIVLQAIVNMMVATGLLPTKGLSLPFISYGGTSMVINLLTVGMLMGMDMQKPSEQS